MILDPLSAYIGPTVSMNQANEVRGAFRSLYAMAQRTKCAVRIVAHMNKMSGISALYRTSGSIDIAGAVRSILTVTRYQRSLTQRVLVPVKSNLAAAGPALLFELSDHVEWLRQLDEDAESLESNLYRGAWPPHGASRQPFLINRNGRLNGDISAAGLAQDRPRSRIPASNCTGLLCAKDAQAFPKTHNSIIRL